MPPALQFPAPSSSLLRFLRLQSELPSVGPSHSRGLPSPTCRRTPRPASQRRLCTAAGRAAKAWPKTRQLSTTSCRGAAVVLQAGIWDLESILPKSSRKQRTTSLKPPTQRLASSDSNGPSDDFSSRPSWQEKFWAARQGKSDHPLQPGDLPDHSGSEFSFMFNSRRLQTAKAALEPRLRCTEVDENGEVILVDGEFKKTELIAKYGLLPRDLRKIDSSNLPHILVRPAAILLNLLHLKVLIKADRVLLFDVYGSTTSYPQSAFIYDLQGRLRQKQSPSAGGLPYEFRALEAVLMSVTSELEADFDTVRDPVIRILTELEEDITRDKLRILLVLSKKVSTFEQKAKLVRDAIEELLEADDDLAAMYLTEKKHDLYRGEDDHTEVEMLLESYHKVCDEVAQEAGNLVSSIRNTEEIIRAILDANRNALMLLDLKFSIGTLGLAMGTFLAGLYGMNLENFIEETHWGFGGVTGMSIVFSLFVCWYGLIKLRKVQRVKMTADRARAGSDSHWFVHDRPVGGLLEARNRERMRRLGMLKEAGLLDKRC